MAKRKTTDTLSRDCRDLVDAWHRIVIADGAANGDQTPLNTAMTALSQKAKTVVTSGRISEWKRGIQRPNQEVVRAMMMAVLPAALAAEGIDGSGLRPDDLRRLVDRLLPVRLNRPKG